MNIPLQKLADEYGLKPDSYYATGYYNRFNISPYYCIRFSLKDLRKTKIECIVSKFEYDEIIKAGCEEKT
jgi:hypothetical protein